MLVYEALTIHHVTLSGRKLVLPSDIISGERIHPPSKRLCPRMAWCRLGRYANKSSPWIIAVRGTSNLPDEAKPALTKPGPGATFRIVD